ncbi:TonB-dependent siderophore receptor [Pseudoalteromonas piscicida]|uniref:TonB-dependent siderophore receptor n=1 Tax=Pseudoalteromonas piscicida TaxID=43662 RepID=UPI000E35FFD6|nr:TonB-dependent siderophore receptor [Pseudoalteromonas piscicida]AXQ97254.1 TonB-dependent siderophore receptor [Pseudoalteromonas piscicida]
MRSSSPRTINHSLTLSLCATFVLFSLHGNAHAAEVADDMLAADAAGDGRAQELEHIYVTGTSVKNYTESANKAALKMILSQRETPQAVTVITNQMMQDWQTVNIDEILEHATGFYAKRGASLDRTRFSVRGGDVNLIQIDGVQQFPGGRRPNVNGDAVAYERVEIVRGANGLLTGVGDPTATVNLVRKRATSDEFKGSVAVSAGSWNNYRAEVDVASGLNQEGSIRGRFVAAHYERDSYIERYSQEKTSIYSTVEADLTDYTLLRLGVEYADTASKGAINSHSQPYFYADGSRYQGRRGDTGMTAKWSSWPIEEYTYFVGLDHAFENDWQLHAIATYNTIEMQGGQLFFVYPDGPVNPDGSSDNGFGYSAVISSSEDEQKTIDLSLQGPVELFGRTHDVIFSYNQFKRERTSFGNEADQTTISLEGLNFHDWTGDVPRYPFKDLGRDSLTVTDSNGGFVAARVNPHDDVKLIVGARLTNWEYDIDLYDPNNGKFLRNRYHEKVDTEVTPYAGVVVDINEQYSVYASYTEAFHPQAYFDINDKMLDPSTGESYELGVKGELLDDTLNFTAAVYRNVENGLAIADPNYPDSYLTPQGNRPYIQRGEGDTTEGFEVEFTGSINEQWNISLGLSKHKTESKDGKELLTDQPKELINLYTTYDFSEFVDGLTAGLGINWQGSFYAIPQRPLPGGGSEAYKITQSSGALLNLMARYEVSEQLSVSLNFNNLLDESYYSSISSWDGYVMHGEPFNWQLGMRYRF